MTPPITKTSLCVYSSNPQKENNFVIDPSHPDHLLFEMIKEIPNIQVQKNQNKDKKTNFTAELYMH